MNKPTSTELIMRHDDPDGDKVWFRSKRVFHTGDGWYVVTREGNLGPFSEEQLADVELQQYIEELKKHEV